MRTTWWIILAAALLVACPDPDDGGFADDDDAVTDDDDAVDDDDLTQDDDDAADDDDAVDDDDAASLSYPVADSDQGACWDEAIDIVCPDDGEAFSGQDAWYDGLLPSYTDNGDGTVTDDVTGLMWQQDPGDKQHWSDAVDGADSFSLAGHADWRVPTVKELYSLILFSGEDPSGETGDDTSGLVPFIDDDVFAFEYGDPDVGDRIIDSQWVTSSVYGGSVMGGDECFFGLNFADGRIKCYPTSNFKSYFAVYVRGNTEYGVNDFTDNGDGTVTDAATGLTWQQADNGAGVTWEDALALCEELDLGGDDDWRLPGAKELQSIVDYDRSPDVTGSAAIDPVFDTTPITNEAGQADYAWYWTSTTHASSNGMGGSAAYVAFGRATGYWQNQWQDVHGAGAQRSDPKTGDPDDWPTGHGPQGDGIRIFNEVRCVRGLATPGNPGDGDGVGDDDDAAGDDDDDGPPAPPQEAIDACLGLDLNDSCSFEGPMGQITGTCEDIDGVLACAPDGGPPQ